MSTFIESLLNSWSSNRNVLIYGPPGTGKTRTIGELFDMLQEPPEASSGILMNPLDAAAPFSRPRIDIPIPQPVNVVWATFHQSFGYEDFVIGMRPEISQGETRLVPHAGLFLDAALELADPNSNYKSVVIFIDEINRGNAARIFGEFLTFLDFDYRDEGTIPLPLPLRQLAYSEGLSEEIVRLNGARVRIPDDFTFPKHVYVVGTMNSVDRAAIPIDSALARRFDRLEMRPDLHVLQELWSIDDTRLDNRSDESWHTLSPFETAYLLLDRLNVSIASDLGTEFELGHGLLVPLRRSGTEGVGDNVPTDDATAWEQLFNLWDQVIYPQLEDRYSGRIEQLLSLLRVDEPPTEGRYAFSLRSTRNGSMSSRALAPVRLGEIDVDTARRTLRWLAR